eukprot:scaffold26656_cov149-Skeletonema_menzelii.AAC.17
MWSNGKDTNEHGESVLLLQPINGKRRGNRTTSASSSHVGGLPVYHDDDHQYLTDSGLKSMNPKCTKCKTQMHLLLQLHAPLDDLDRTLYVFGCNNPLCHLPEECKSLNGNRDEAVKTRFCANFAGTVGGAVRCFRSQWQQPNTYATPVEEKPLEVKEKTPQCLEENDWGMDDDCGGWGDADDDDNDWGNSSGANNVDMSDLETMLMNCEMQSHATALPTKTSVPQANSNHHAKEKRRDVSGPSFVHHDLEMIDEPVGKTQNDSSDDENDDDDFVANVDSSKVDSMLSRYLEMEDDEDIIAVLKGGSNTTTNTCGGGNVEGGEKYERLKPEEKAFMLFSKRLKRAPAQVCRYAYGGEPLWSIPLPPVTDGKRKHQKAKKNTKGITAPFPSIPSCACGSERVFEFQLLPCLLHVLDVDSVRSNSDDGKDITDLTSIGGMNWGSIAVYSCPESCDESREEFLIVQYEDDVGKKPEPMSEDENGNNE